MEEHIRPRLSHSNSFGNDAEKDTAGCRALDRKYIVIGVTIMRNEHTIEERLEAVLACLEGGRALQEVAQAHQVAVQTLRSWVKKYQE